MLYTILWVVYYGQMTSVPTAMFDLTATQYCLLIFIKLGMDP